MRKRVFGFFLGLAMLALPVYGQSFDLHQAFVHSSPADIADWPVTGHISQIQVQPSGSANEGLSFIFDKSEVWPSTVDNGVTFGGLQYTVWAVLNIGGQWHTAGFIQMWRGRPNTGSPPLKFGQDWAYSDRWGPLAHYTPQVGEQMGFFLSAGNARDLGVVTTVRERTDVAFITVPAGDVGNFDFGGIVQPVPPVLPIPTVPVPVPTPPVPTLPVPTPPVPMPPVIIDTASIQAALARIEVAVAEVHTSLEAHRAATLHVLTSLLKYLGPTFGGLVAGLKLTK